MPTALLAWELGSGFGHCVNLVPIAQQLQDLGWRVWVAARDVTVAERALRPLPVQYLQAPVLLARPVAPISPTRSFAHILHNVGFGDDNQLRVLMQAWWHLFDLAQPDVLVCEHAPTALLASRKFNLRRVTLGTGFFSPPDVSPLPEIRYWLASDVGKLAQDEARLLQTVNLVLVRENLQPLARLSQLYAEVDANFLLTFRELDHYPQRPEGEYFGMWSLPHENRPSWPEGEGPRVFAYLKQLPSSAQMSAYLATIREVNVPSLVYIPDGSPAWLRRFDSPKLRFSTVPLDIREVGRDCDLAILNGNAGTATELLLRGVPQLHLPLYLEQEVFSRRVVDLGAGLLAVPNRTEQFAIQLATLVHQLNRYREVAQQFAALHADFDAAASAAIIAKHIGHWPTRVERHDAPHPKP